jgi:hypothetical protein
MEPELEAGDDAEVAAAAAQRPEKIGVLGGAGAHHFAGRRHDLGRLQVVDGHPVLAAQPAEAAAQRQPGKAGGRVDADRRGETVGLGGCVEIREQGAGLDESRGARRDRPRGLHPGEIDDDAAVAHGIAGDVVAAAADGERQSGIHRES